eukprot:7404006-Pyramimonas_sp.AAC.1
MSWCNSGQRTGDPPAGEVPDNWLRKTDWFTCVLAVNVSWCVRAPNASPARAHYRVTHARAGHPKSGWSSLGVQLSFQASMATFQVWTSNTSPRARDRVTHARAGHPKTKVW